MMLARITYTSISFFMDCTPAELDEWEEVAIKVLKREQHGRK